MARIFLDEMGGINQGGVLASYGLPMSPFSTEEYAPTIVETPSRPTRTRKKQSKSKPKRNDGIIRNHDSVWDYKIQDGKLFTRRKTSNGNWIDITSNDEARTRLEQFTNKSITRPDNNNKPSNDSTPSSPSQRNVVEPNEPIVNLENNLVSRYMPKAITQSNGYIQDFSNIGLPNKNIILSTEDLAKNNWHWGGVDDISFEGVSNNLYADAVNRAQKQGKVLLTKEGKPVTSGQVNRYVGLKDYVPANRMSASDMALYQPQSENSTLKDIRRAQDFRRNRDFDRQRNEGLAIMFGLPLASIGAAEALAAGPLALAGGYLGADLGGNLVNAATQKLYGRTWDEISDDPNVNFYTQMINPGRWLGGALGGYGGAKMWNRMTPIRQYPSGEYEFIGDRIGKVVPKQSASHNRAVVNMLYDPTTNEPVLNGIAPRYTIEIPNNVRSVGPEPLWYDTRFMNTMRDMKASAKGTKPKRSVKTTKGKSKSK